MYLVWFGQGICQHENFWSIMKKEIDNKIVCKKEDMWKRVYEAWYSVAPKVLNELYNSMSR